MSLPSRERGLKSYPLLTTLADASSLPSRERGLKSILIVGLFVKFVVAPLAGAWIEINISCRESIGRKRRSPRGSVD